ncbi:MAG: hypothetical protein ACPG4T_20970 [Nannocystaceae bacterium]
MANPAFTASASETGGATTVEGSTQGPTTGSTAAPTATSTGTTSPETTETETPTTATTATTTSDDTTDTTGPDPTDTDTSDTDPETTEDPCPECLDEDPICLGPNALLLCVDGCSNLTPCEANQLCWTWEDSSSCDEFPADCGEIAADYHALIQGNKTCVNDEDCQALAGNCKMPGGSCWEVVNDDVTIGLIEELRVDWESIGCDKQPGVGCMEQACVEVEMPEVACNFGTCTEL